MLLTITIKFLFLVYKNNYYFGNFAFAILLRKRRENHINNRKAAKFVQNYTNTPNFMNNVIAKVSTCNTNL